VNKREFVDLYLVVFRHNLSVELAGQSPVAFSVGGKSGLRRTKCQITSGGCEFTESATEKIPPLSFDLG
jgi:hypothetical protein